MESRSWNEAGIPAELLQVSHWLVWRYEQRGNKLTKIPYRAAGGGQASTTDASTWSGYTTARSAAARFDGIGFVFTRDDTFVGVDLDACRDPETEEIEDWALRIVNLLDSYTEVTPSGCGLHILCRGRLPVGGRRKGKIEIYEEGRYFTITGQMLQDAPATLEERTDELAVLHQSIFRTEEPMVARSNGAASINADQWAVIEKVLRHPKGSALWRGDITGYGSQSEADLALCSLVAFYAGPDASLIDRIVRQSDLIREKWDSSRPGGTYGSQTIAKALSGKGEFYHWRGKGADLGTSVVNVVSSLAKKTLKPAVDLEPEALYGLPGRVVRAIDPHTESSQAAILASFLIGAGCLIGPRPFVYRDGARHCANEFGCLVGLSSKGRKGTATRRTDEIFRYACGGLSNDINDKRVTCHERSLSLPAWNEVVLTGIGSGEGLIQSLADAQEEGEDHPRRIVFEEEFSKALKVMQREGSTLSENLRAAWDGGILANRTKGKTLLVQSSHVSILSHVTENELRVRLQNTEMFNGFANRFLWFCTQRSKSLPFGGGRVNLDQLVTDLLSALTEAASCFQMEFDDETRRLWSEGGIYDLLTDRPAGLLGAVTSRAEAHVTRLALLYALLDRSPEIRKEHLLAALAVWDYSERSCAYIFGYSLGDDYADLLLEMLLDVYPGGLTRTEIRDKFGRNAPAGRIPKALEMLQSGGQAQVTKSGTEGRPIEYWSYVVPDGSDYDLRQNDINDKSPLCRARSLLEGR